MIRQLPLLASSFLTSFANAAVVELSIKAGANGSDFITVAPGDSVPFHVEVSLVDAAIEDLAVVAFDMRFAGAAVVLGGEAPGSTDSDSFIAEVLGEDFIQHAGTVAHLVPQVVVVGPASPTAVASGSVNAPGAEGVYTLEFGSVYANVLRSSESGDPSPAAAPLTVGLTANLTAIVSSGIDASLVGHDPPCGSSLPRMANNFIRLRFDAPVTLPTPGQIKIQALADEGGFHPTDLSIQFFFTLEDGDTVLRLQENDRVLETSTWYAVRNTGGWPGVAPFAPRVVVVVGDVTDNGLVDVFDLRMIWEGRGLASPDSRLDVNGNGLIDVFDVSAAWTWRSYPELPIPSGHTCFSPP